MLATYAALFRRALAMMLASPLRPFLWLAGPAIVAAKVAPVAAVWLGGQALNELQQAAAGHAFTPRLIGLGFALAALAGARIVFGAISDIVRQRLDLDVEIHFEIIEARKLAALDIGAREDAAFQDLHQNVESAGARILTDLLKQPVEIVGNIAGLVTAAALVAQQSPLYLALIVLVSLPFMWTEYRAGAREYDARWISTPRRRAYFRALAAITDAASALELKVLGSIDRVVDETVALSKSVKQQQLAARRRGVLENLVVSLAVALAVGALAVLVVRDAVAGALALGTAVFLMSSLWQVSGLFGSLYREFAQAPNTLRAARDFFRFLDWKPAVDWPADGWRVPPTDKVEIAFENVSFRYPGRADYALREISCRFELGQRVGVVGKNGSGKSTFIKLLLRIYDPVEGRILYNGRDLREADLADLYRAVSLLPQDVQNYEFTSVAGNVELGAPMPLGPAALTRALDASEADDFVRDLPKGAETPLGREFGGVRLSGGQAQRLAIARALYKRPRILVLDEPTSAIDALSEQLIFDRLMGADADARLTICISHRFTTLARADRILVFEDGRIAEQGTPADLRRAGGAYQALFDAQTKFLS